MTSRETYHRPDTLDDALRLLADGGLRVAAGCTDLFPATERKVLPGPTLDITGIAALRGIRESAGGITIGATTTWSDVRAAKLPPALDGLKRAAREVGARQIQNRGTVAGNLCNASPAADGVPPLLTLDAEVTLQSRRGARQLPLSRFLTGPRQTARQKDELVTAIRIPLAALAGDSHFLKLGARTSLVISIAMVAARIVTEGGMVTEAALAIGACSPVATRLDRAEKALLGAALDPARVTDQLVTGALSPIGDVRADAAYRARAAAELLRRALAAMVPERAAA